MLLALVPLANAKHAIKYLLIANPCDNSGSPRTKEDEIEITSRIDKTKAVELAIISIENIRSRKRPDIIGTRSFAPVEQNLFEKTVCLYYSFKNIFSHRIQITKNYYKAVQNLMSLNVRVGQIH